MLSLHQWKLELIYYIAIIMAIKKAYILINKEIYVFYSYEFLYGAFL